MPADDTLAAQALTQLFRNQLVIALLLFLPAWTFAYPQAWQLWFVFGIANLGITLYFLRHDPALIRRRMEVGAAAEERPKQKLLQGISGILICALVVVPALDHRFHWSAVPDAVSAVALAVFALCMLMVFFVYRQNTYTAATVTVESDQYVVSTGLYGLVRHPMYSASIILFIATPLALGSLWGLPVAAVLSGLLILRLLDEEEHLAEFLPGYPAYRDRVRYRLFPGIW